MKLSDFKALAKIFVQADVPCRVLGDGGIGKSEVVQQVAKELGMNFVDLRLATQEVGDLIGLPFVDDTGENPITRWAQPVWLQEIWDKHHQGIPTLLAMEEKSRAPNEVTQAVFQILTERRLHQYDLPSDCRLFALDNPPTEEYQVTPADRAENTRWANVFVIANTEDWIENYAVENIADELTTFMAANQDVFN